MNKIKYHILTLVAFCLIFTACLNSNENSDKKPILLADREAPVGWVYLRIYEDSTFEFSGNEYHGTVFFNNDTLLFNYEGSVPKAGKTAIIKGKYLTYIEGTYREQLEIKLNNLTK